MGAQAQVKCHCFFNDILLIPLSRAGSRSPLSGHKSLWGTIQAEDIAEKSAFAAVTVWLSVNLVCVYLIHNFLSTGRQWQTLDWAALPVWYSLTLEQALNLMLRDHGPSLAWRWFWGSLKCFPCQKQTLPATPSQSESEPSWTVVPTVAAGPSLLLPAAAGKNCH